MAFEIKDDAFRFDTSIEDAKLIYRVLHRHLRENLELMDCAFFDSLQSALQRKAQDEGVDVSHHGAWDLWLGNENAPSCEVRLKERKIL